ncbi:hypothetical protein B0T20DRAFT_389786 [Sordaria brevicollis]|uniref:Uncharacterized protein n=1 Tax=Sordaria brevicollis TaxID=83679 RepID=A0AAE0PL38_SORBR|nr:hypothetical protein B0T20DRAFT_389786 [Sordaria brevicollis]
MLSELGREAEGPRRRPLPYCIPTRLPTNKPGIIGVRRPGSNHLQIPWGWIQINVEFDKSCMRGSIFHEVGKGKAAKVLGRQGAHKLTRFAIVAVVGPWKKDAMWILMSLVHGRVCRLLLLSRRVQKGGPGRFWRATGQLHVPVPQSQASPLQDQTSMTGKEVQIIAVVLCIEVLNHPDCVSDRVFKTQNFTPTFRADEPYRDDHGKQLANDKMLWTYRLRDVYRPDEEG